MGQVRHLLYDSLPFVIRITIWHDDNTTAPQRCEHLTLDHPLVARCHPEVIRQGSSTDDSILWTFHQHHRGTRIPSQKMLTKEAIPIQMRLWWQLALFLQ